MKSALSITKVDRIRALASELDQLGKSALEKAIEAGGLLKECKAGLDHGQWLPWLKFNFSFTDRTARNWMRISDASASGKLETVSDLSEAYRITTKPKETVEKSPFILPPVGQRLILVSPIHGDKTIAAFEPMDETFIRVSWIEDIEAEDIEVLETRRGIRRDHTWNFLVSQSRVNWRGHVPVYTPWHPTTAAPLIELQEIEEVSP